MTANSFHAGLVDVHAVVAIWRVHGLVEFTTTFMDAVLRLDGELNLWHMCVQVQAAGTPAAASMTLSGLGYPSKPSWVLTANSSHFHLDAN